jgi:hypothetical protein
VWLIADIESNASPERIEKVLKTSSNETFQNGIQGDEDWIQIGSDGLEKETPELNTISPKIKPNIQVVHTMYPSERSVEDFDFLKVNLPFQQVALAKWSQNFNLMFWMSSGERICTLNLIFVGLGRWTVFWKEENTLVKIWTWTLISVEILKGNCYNEDYMILSQHGSHSLMPSRGQQYCSLTPSPLVCGSWKFDHASSF